MICQDFRVYFNTQMRSSKISRHTSTFASRPLQVIGLTAIVPHPAPPLLLSRCLDPRSSGPPRSGFLSVISNTFERGMNLKLLGNTFLLFLALNLGLFGSLRLFAEFFPDASFIPSTFHHLSPHNYSQVCMTFSSSLAPSPSEPRPRPCHLSQPVSSAAHTG